MFERIEKFVERLSSVGLWIAQILIVYMVAHILLEVTLRAFFDTSTYSATEFVGYALCGMVFFGLAETFHERRHVRVSLLIAHLPPSGQRVLELVCLAATAVVMGMLTWVMWLTFLKDFKRGSVAPTLMATPTWIIDAAVLTGLVIFMLQIVVSFIRTAISGMKPDAPELEA